MIEAFANTPGPSLQFHCVLQVAPRHVQAHCVTKDVLVRIDGADVTSPRSYGDDQLNFMVQIGGEGGVGHDCGVIRRSHQHGIGRLHEKEWGFPLGVTHFLGMVFVVSTYAVDTVDGKVI
jgi:hypothetical protein